MGVSVLTKPSTEPNLSRNLRGVREKNKSPSIVVVGWRNTNVIEGGRIDDGKVVADGSLGGTCLSASQLDMIRRAQRLAV